jgi:hypothetical protein
VDKSKIATSLALVAFLSATPANAQFWKNLLNNNDQYQQPYQQGFMPGQQNVVNPNLSRVSDSLKNIERSCDQMAKNVQMRAAMDPNAAPLMMSLNALKDTSRQARRAADNGNQSQLVMQLSQLQVVAGNAVTVAQRAQMDSYTLGQLQMIQASVNQSIMLANAAPPVVPVNPYNPYNPNPYNPNPYNPYNPGFVPGYASGMISATGRGRGQFSLMGQVLMGIKQASINCSDPVGKRTTFTISGGPAAINLTGVMTMQTPTSASIAINGSDKGAATGMVNAAFSPDGALSSVNGNGTLNGQAFALSFRGEG